MNILYDLVKNHVFICAFFSFLAAQIIKSIISTVINKKFILERLTGDGGMPSGHSAFVSGMALMCGWCTGFSSSVFGVAMIVAIVVMHDASGVRRETGKQAVTLREMSAILNDWIKEKDEEIRTDKLKVLVGHSPLQVFFGSLTGICVALIYIAVLAWGFGYEYAFLAAPAV